MSNKERESRSFWEEEDSLLLENDRKRRRRVMGLELEAPEPVTEREAGGPRIRQTDKPLPALKVWHSEVGSKVGRGASNGDRDPFFSPRTFAEVGASVELQTALGACGAVTPSHVQAAGYDVIAAGKDMILADQTGSGKTLGYLGPVVQRLRELERREGKTPPGQVRAIVLVPTAELAQQVLRVAKALSAGGAPFRSTIVTGEHKWGTQRKALAAGVELVVATPGRLRSHLNAEQASLQLGGLAHLVLDEADVLYGDDDFAAVWDELRGALPPRAAVAFVTATLTPAAQQAIEAQFPLVERRRGRGLHRTAQGVAEKLIDCSAGGSGSGGPDGFELKMGALLSELRESEEEHTLVFCNTIEACRRVENALRRADRGGHAYRLWAYHSAINPEGRQRALQQFAQPQAEGVGAGRDGDPLPRLLVCTDRASRGMDFPQVGHVILFDFPRDGVEYVRRVGRATRGANQPGRVTSLLLGRQVAYARTLMKLNQAGEAIDLETHSDRR